MPWGYYAYVIGDDGHVANRIEVHCNNDRAMARDPSGSDHYAQQRSMRIRTPKAPIIVQVSDVLRRARKLPPGPARNDLRQLARGLLKLHRAGLRGNVQIVEKATTH